jgi:hypothetical protein
MHTVRSDNFHMLFDIHFGFSVGTGNAPEVRWLP